jgi:MFS family permease
VTPSAPSRTQSSLRTLGGLPQAVIALGLVSLLTDLSSEMIYPLIPEFLAGVLGAGAVALGVIEGAAEATASLLKIASGLVADRFRRRKPLVIAGYTISGGVRPLIGLAASWPVVLALRVLDRVGKGVRTSPRDALIADVTPNDRLGRAYGVHRAMDNAGAVMGPLVAALLLGAGFSVRHVFLWAAVPGVLVVLLLVFGVREKARERSAPVHASAPKAPSTARLDASYRKLLFVIVLFTLGNSSDTFLLLRLSKAGLTNSQITLAWAAHSAMRTVAVLIGGPLADRIDRRALLAVGWALYAAVYATMAVVHSASGLVVLLVVYGAYYGATEPTERAIVADLAPAELRGAAFGWYHGAVGIAALPASALFGLLWLEVGAPAAFATGAALAVSALVALAVLIRPRAARVA